MYSVIPNINIIKGILDEIRNSSFTNFSAVHSSNYVMGHLTNDSEINLTEITDDIQDYIKKKIKTINYDINKYVIQFITYDNDHKPLYWNKEEVKKGWLYDENKQRVELKNAIHNNYYKLRYVNVIDNIIHYCEDTHLFKINDDCNYSSFNEFEMINDIHKTSSN